MRASHDHYLVPLSRRAKAVLKFMVRWGWLSGTISLFAGGFSRLSAAFNYQPSGRVTADRRGLPSQSS
jgi:hypothetical protein